MVTKTSKKVSCKTKIHFTEYPRLLDSFFFFFANLYLHAVDFLLEKWSV